MGLTEHATRMEEMRNICIMKLQKIVEEIQQVTGEIIFYWIVKL